MSATRMRMASEEYYRRLNELRAEIETVPAQHRAALRAEADRVLAQHEQMRRTSDRVDELLADLELIVKYT